MITRAESVFALRAPRTPVHAPIAEKNGTAARNPCALPAITICEDCDWG